MTDWNLEYDDDRRPLTADEPNLGRYLAEREAELAERESRLREREKEALDFYHDAEAKHAADAAQWRLLLTELTPDTTGAEIIGLFKRHGMWLVPG